MRILREAVGGGLDADLGEQRDRALARLLLGQLVVLAERLEQLEADRLHRVQRAERVLEDHGHPAAAHVAQELLRRAGELELAEPDRPRGDVPRRLEQPEHGERHRRLARARLADEREPLAASELEGQIVDRADNAAVDRILDLQPLDPEDGIAPSVADRDRAARRRGHQRDNPNRRETPPALARPPVACTARLPRWIACSMPALISR